jgi:hypothetical protein
VLQCFNSRWFLWDTWDKAGTQKRGGGVQKVPLVDNDVS